MSNRLFHFSHLLAYSIENDETLWYPFINEFRIYFPNLNQDNLSKYRVLTTSGSIINFFLRAISWALPRINLGKYYLNAAADEEITLSKVVRAVKPRLIFTRGWLLRDYQSVRKYREILKVIFKFPQRVEQDIKCQLNHIRRPNSLLIGVHIRRGDYISHEDGKYFYGIESYISFVMHMNTLCAAKSKDALFLVATNDNDVVDYFKSRYPNIYVFSHDAVTDLCMLSLCDYIIGPPSTFSSWASFYGEVPLLHIKTSTQSFELCDFEVIEG